MTFIKTNNIAEFRRNKFQFYRLENYRRNNINTRFNSPLHAQMKTQFYTIQFQKMRKLK